MKLIRTFILAVLLLSTIVWAQKSNDMLPGVNELPIIVKLPDPWVFFVTNKWVAASEAWNLRIQPDSYTLRSSPNPIFELYRKAKTIWTAKNAHDGESSKTLFWKMEICIFTSVQEKMI